MRISVGCRAMLLSVLLISPYATHAASKADNYPSKPIRIVVAYAPGGPIDSAARIISEKLSIELGQPVTVENRSGGNAVIGTVYVARSPADGYTLLLAAPAHTSNPSLSKTAGYDPIKDFSPIALINLQPLFVVVPTSLGINKLSELISLLKANPGKFNYGSSGSGGPQHLMGEMFKTATDTQITHIPYRGAAPAAVALLAGETQMSFSTPTNTISYIKTGQLKALAVSTSSRTSLAPEVPTLIDLGVTGFNYSSWAGLLAPAGTDKAIIQRLNAALNKVLSAKDVQEKFTLQGSEVVGGSPEEFMKFLIMDVNRSSKIIKDNNIQLD